ncbi:hypothetical protein [Streptomyces sp. NPDC058240]|uniref:hypothetical protein n=1 Tax=Streptomyces sp. NPDC058240 TaxID=3346396 RepID=UPI0036E048AB
MPGALARRVRRQVGPARDGTELRLSPRSERQRRRVQRGGTFRAGSPVRPQGGKVPAPGDEREALEVVALTDARQRRVVED